MLAAVLCLLMLLMGASGWLIARRAWRVLERARRREICYFCGHELTEFAGGRVPHCPECGRVSGPSSRWRVALLPLKDSSSSGLIVLTTVMLIALVAAGPVFSALASRSAISPGAMIWVCEQLPSAWRDALVEQLCARDARIAFAPSERARLAEMILDDLERLELPLIGARRDAIIRIMSASQLTADQSARYQAVRLKADEASKKSSRFESSQKVVPKDAEGLPLSWRRGDPKPTNIWSNISMPEGGTLPEFRGANGNSDR